MVENKPKEMSFVELDCEYTALIMIIRMKAEYLSGLKRVGLSVSKAPREM